MRSRSRARRARGDRVHLAPQGRVQRVQLRAERLALRRAGRDQLVERAAERLGQGGPRDRLDRRLRVFHAHDPRPLEHPRERHVAADAHAATELARFGDELRGQRVVDADPLRGLARCCAELHGHVDPTALEPRLDQPARVHLERGERARETKRNVEVAVIDGARFDRHGHRVAAALGPTESRHAANGGNSIKPGRCHQAIIGRNSL